MNQSSETGILEPAWGRVLRIWWSLVWRTNLLGILTGLLVGTIAEFTARQFGMIPGRAGVVTFFAVYVLMGIVALKWLLHARFHSFKIVLMSRR